MCSLWWYNKRENFSYSLLMVKRFEGDVWFFALQAYLLKNDENKALKPAELQKELNNMLKFNPDFSEAVRSSHAMSVV